MAECTINGYALPDENLTVRDRTSSDIHSPNSGRGETGVMNIDYVRSDVRKLDIQLVNITGEQYSALRTAVATKPQTVIVKDELGADISISMYNSDVSDTMKFIDSSGTRYYDVSFSLTEL